MKLLLLNREEELVSIISETTSDPIYDEVLNGEDTFEFEVSELSIEKGYRVLFQDINSDWREYIVTGIEEKHNRNGLRKKVYCESSYYELLGDWLADIRPNNRTARYALEQALSTSRWEVGVVDDLGLNSTNYYRTDAKTAVEKVAEVWGGEIKTRIEVAGNKVTGRFVDLYRNRGTDSGKRFTYTKDIEEVTRDVSEDLIITALHGFGKSEEIGDGFGRRIDFSFINNGKTYLENNSARLMYGRNNSDGTKSHVFGKVEFDDIEDIELLKTEAQKALDALSIPSVLYKVQVQDLSVFGYEHEKVNLGDYVLIADKEFIPELRFKARVVGIKRNLANELETEITIGNVLESYTSKMNSQSNALNDIRDRIGVLDKIADGSYQLPRADGQGYNYYGSVAPSNPHNGDIWFKPNGEYQEMWQYVDGQWTLLIDTSVPDQLKQEVDAAISEAESAKQAAEQAYANAVTEAERLVAEQSETFDAKFETETGTIRNEIEQSYTDAVTEAKAHTDEQNTIVDGKIADVEQEVTDVKQTADKVAGEVNAAISNAGFTSLSDMIQNMNYITMNAEQNAQQAISDASSAHGLAQTSISEAQTAQANSLTALGKADNALDGVSNLDIRVDDVEAELAVKADNTFMNEDGTLTTLSNAITFNAYRFRSDMSRIESRVESLASEVNLVILRGSIENRLLYGGEVFPNSPNGSSTNVMGELIDVVGGESFALSKEMTGSDDRWRINFYDENHDFISRFHPPANTQDIMNAPSNARYMWVSYPKNSKPQIVRGTDFIPYRPNMADQMTTDEMVIFRNEYDEYADRTERRLSTIDSSGGRLEVAETLITQTADGLQATVGKVDNQGSRLSTVEQTANGLKSEVYNADGSSKVTQLANGYNILVAESPKSLVVRNFSDNTSGWVFGVDVEYQTSIDNLAQIYVTGSNPDTLYDGNRIYVNSVLKIGRRYKITLDVWTVGPRNISIGQASSSNNVRLAVDNYTKTYEVIYEAPNANGFSIYFHDEGTYRIGNITVVESTAISQSQISVLQNNINLRVVKGEVVSQINIEANRTLISSGKILLDGDTYIMGTTFVNDIKAKSLEAVNADVANLRTKILTADAITSTHLKVDNALIDKLTATTAVVDRFFSKSAVIDNLSAKTLTAITANITSIRSQVLVADVVTSTHLKSDVALINKLFATTALINELTSKTAFINSIKAINISADKVNTGTLNAADVNIINLNASAITTGTLSGVNASWNLNTGIFESKLASAPDTRVLMNGGKIQSFSNRYGTGELIGGRLALEDNLGSAVVNTGGLVANASIGTANYTSSGIHFNPTGGSVSKLDFDTSNWRLRISSYNGAEMGTIVGTTYSRRLSVGGGNGGILPFVDVWAELNMQKNTINNVKESVYSHPSTSELGRIKFQGSGVLYVSGRQVVALNVLGSDNSSIYTKFTVGHTENASYQNINMNGNSVTGTSDRRMKTNITATNEGGLATIRQWHFVDYEWRDRNRPQGRQFGLIAQDSPGIGFESEDGTWQINSSKQTMLNSLGIKELDTKLTRIDTFVSQHILEIQQLKQKIAELESKIA